MRLTIYIPLLDPPNRYLAPMAVVVASATAMLRTYSRLSATRYFYPKWVETRRILTAAYALLYGFIQGEVHLLDFLPIADIATELLERSRKNQPAVDRLIGTWKRLLEIAGQSPSRPCILCTQIGLPLTPSGWTKSQGSRVYWREYPSSQRGELV